MTSDHPVRLSPARVALQVRRWDVETGKVLQEAQLHEKQISDMQVRGAGQCRGQRPRVAHIVAGTGAERQASGLECGPQWACWLGPCNVSP